MQIKARRFIAVVVLIIVIAFSLDFGLTNLMTHRITTYTTFTTVHTNVTFVQISGTNHSLFYVTKVAIVGPEAINGVCIASVTNATLSTTYTFPTEGLNGSNPIGLVTTSTSYESTTTATIYENVTIVQNGSTCTLINSHYNITQTPNCPECV